jgi:hypothetical protein
MKSLKIFVILFFFSFSLYAQNDNTTPKPADKPKTEKKYIDLEELRAMKANGATDEEVNVRYNEMIEAIDQDFHGVPVKKMKESDLSTQKNATQLLKNIKPLSL